MSQRSPQDIYVDMLLPLRLGYPLWHAEPEKVIDSPDRPIELGAVGYIDDGRFRQLFNVCKPADDKLNRNRVPPTFEVLHDLFMQRSGPTPVSQQEVVASPTIRFSTISTASPVSNGGEVTFECTADAGALLAFKGPLMEEQIIQKPLIVDYLNDHIDHWLQFLRTSGGYELMAEDLAFISGTVKVPWFASVAFDDSSYRGRYGTLHFSPAAGDNIDFSVSFSEPNLAALAFKHGPERSTRISIDELLQLENPGWAPPRSLSEKPDLQPCVFIHYYKVKIRSDGSSQLGKMNDPLICLLDYILEHSNANRAIASDVDLYTIFARVGFPKDVKAGLNAVKPAIHVDANGVGIISP